MTHMSGEEENSSISRAAVMLVAWLLVLLGIAFIWVGLAVIEGPEPVAFGVIAFCGSTYIAGFLVAEGNCEKEHAK